MERTRQKVRVTVSLPAAVARQLDEQRSGLGLNRSEAVEKAVAEWLRRRIEADQGRIIGLSERMDEQSRTLERATRMAAEIVLEALRYQFPHLQEFGSDELSRRAAARLRREELRR